MAFKKFNENDVFYNRIKTYPDNHFAIYDGKVYRQRETEISGAFVSSTPNTPTGFVSLYEMNVDRAADSTGLIYPFVVKNGTLSNFNTISTSEFGSFSYGDTISGSYPLTASISREYFQLGQSRRPLMLYTTL